MDNFSRNTFTLCVKENVFEYAPLFIDIIFVPIEFVIPVNLWQYIVEFLVVPFVVLLVDFWWYIIFVANEIEADQWMVV